MKVFISGNIASVGIKKLEENNISITQWKENRQITPQELIEACQDQDALISVGPNKINAEFLKACSHLKVIALHSVGYDNVDIAAAKALGIPIGNTPGVLSAATADTAFLLMLAVSRKAFYSHKKIIKGEWKNYEPSPELGIEVNGKTLGIFGLGKIGLEMAKKCIGAYSMSVIYYNRSRNEEAEKEIGAKYVSFEELLAQSDVLSIHTALTPETKGKFTLDVFKQMRPNSIFINTARGGIHNEKDLIKALEEKMIWGAGLDVTNPEPTDKNNPLLAMENVAVLPHIGSATEETRAAMAQIIVKNVLAGLKGEKLPFEVK
ncbi:MULTISPECIES: 2-hydroxyacid dehydrogenase [unclassified Pedobacter]|uniref:2-hydroxyacid dehydrogenase n=1 Tax=unclassified Pedobacter TaxID=2628915 RepID=UPI001423CB9C|nr:MULTISPECIES: D-glycerate dehydrogenase [unclassified Pedobacter]NII85661.1 lactate dehydrogenase-like 2-hydroxyacid dehydrogenase [Pedobacter sp. SG908]NMN39423.1 lactate dehydrogenase-like 2-hydroxyacid dehydrogenase [Pedobacter sp. SG918]